MLRIIFLTITGFLLLVAGCFLAYLYLQGLGESNKLWLLVISFALIGTGVFLLYRGGKSDGAIGVKKIQPAEQSTQPGLANKLQKDNQILSQWTKTTEARDRLRMLEISAKAEEGK